MDNKNPNAIIRALLDIAQAAYVLIHSPGRDMADNLRRNMALLEELPQYCNNPVNGPCRARKYLESFLVGGSMLDRDEEIESLAQKRARHFPPMVVSVANLSAEQKNELLEHLNLKIKNQASTPLVPGDAIGFEVTQEWKGPAKLRIEPEFVPSAEFPTSGPIHHDFYTHRDAWRDIIVKLMNTALEDNVDDHLHVEHELRAFDRAFASLPPERERRLRPRMIEPSISKAEVLNTMLADTADEAHKIFNDAHLLANLAEIVGNKGVGSVAIYTGDDRARIEVIPARGSDESARDYTSTSFHQAIVVAHKGEHDLKYPEPK